jgi:hypothetical protein
MELTKRQAEIIWICRPLGWLTVLIAQVWIWGGLYTFVRYGWQSYSPVFVFIMLLGIVATFYMPWMHRKARKILKSVKS